MESHTFFFRGLTSTNAPCDPTFPWCQGLGRCCFCRWSWEPRISDRIVIQIHGTRQMLKNKPVFFLNRAVLYFFHFQTCSWFMYYYIIYIYQEPQTTIYKWMFGETTISYIKTWNHPIETTIYKWLFGVPGISVFLRKQLHPTLAGPLNWLLRRFGQQYDLNVSWKLISCPTGIGW